MGLETMVGAVQPDIRTPRKRHDSLGQLTSPLRQSDIQASLPPPEPESLDLELEGPESIPLANDSAQGFSKILPGDYTTIDAARIVAKLALGAVQDAYSSLVREVRAYEPFVVRRAVGKDGREVTIYKLRTMVRDAESRFSDLAEQNGLDAHGKIKDDPRITPLGRFLRRSKIDEIPQILNVLRGEMSLVGVRPRSAEQWAVYPADLAETARRFRPGLCGVVYANRHARSFPDQIETERRYLLEKSAAPIATDAKYFYLIWRNILSGRVESR